MIFWIEYVRIIKFYLKTQHDMIDPEEIRQEVIIQTFPEHLGTKTEEHTSRKHGEVEEYLNSTVFGQDAQCVK